MIKAPDFDRHGVPAWWWAEGFAPVNRLSRLAIGPDLDLDCEDFGYDSFKNFAEASNIFEADPRTEDMICPITNQKVSLAWLMRRELDDE